MLIWPRISVPLFSRFITVTVEALGIIDSISSEMEVGSSRPGRHPGPFDTDRCANSGFRQVDSYRTERNALTDVDSHVFPLSGRWIAPVNPMLGGH